MTIPEFNSWITYLNVKAKKQDQANKKTTANKRQNLDGMDHRPVMGSGS